MASTTKSITRKLRNLTLAGALALSLIVGGAAATPPSAEAASPNDCYWIYDSGRWWCVPQYCYWYSDAYLRTYYGYYNRKTCVYNHLGYPGIFP